MITLDLTVRADHADELAEAFAYLASNGLHLETAADMASQPPSAPVASITDLNSRRQGEAHA